MLTQKEIADLAGVSRVTVSRVLSGSSLVNAATREKVLRMVNMSGYEVNKSAQALVNHKKKHRIACFYVESDDAFFKNQKMAFVAAVEKYKSYGMDIELHGASEMSLSQFDMLKGLDFEQISGIIISPFGDCKEENVYLEELASKGFPIITVHAYTRNLSPLCRIVNNSHLCGRLAVNLLSLGAVQPTNLGIIVGYDLPAHIDRIEGAKEFIRAHEGIRLVDTAFHNDDAVRGFSETQKMLAQHPEINALFIASGDSSGACRAVIEAGRADSMRIVTVDRRPGTLELMQKGIVCATIDQQEEQQVLDAIDAIYRYLFYHEAPPKEIVTPLKIRLLSNYEDQ